MKKIFSKALFLLIGSLLMTVTLNAQTAESPKIQKYSFSDAAIVYGLSNNGEWALAKSAGESYGESAPRLIHVPTNTVQNILSADFEGTACNVTDVTDDGEIVVGSIADRPAYWRKTPLTEGEFAEQEWILLDIPENWTGGVANAVTPDGKYAVGRCTGFYGQHENDDIPASYEYDITACLWDLATGKLIETPNLPTRDMTHVDQHQLEFLNISPDGRYLLGRMDWSYIHPIALFSFIYDRETATSKAIGFTENPIDDWTPDVEGLVFTDSPIMSPNGKWAAGMAHMVKTAGTGYSESMVTYRYDIINKNFEVFDGEEDNDIIAHSIDNNGVVYGASPAGVPLRDWYVRNGKYWIGFDQICKQQFGFNFYDKYAYEYTGTPWFVNNDGTTLVSMIDPQTGESYILSMSEPVINAAKGIKLLGSYEASPTDGATTAKLRDFTLTFNRNIEVIAEEDAIKIYDEYGEEVRSSNYFQVSNGNPREIEFSVRPLTLDNGAQYTVVIPAGSISIKGDKEHVNEKIVLTYKGRSSSPISMREVSPAEGSELSKIEYRTSPICIRFDSEVYLTDTAYAELYREDLALPICRMTVAYDADSIHIYPATTQYLYEGFNYRVELCANAVVDAGGYCGNEKIAINYKGTYIQKIDNNGKYLFVDTFGDYSQSIYLWMRYEGDHNTPMSNMKAWEFDADNQPWNFSIRDDEGVDACMASHSLYSPSGRSDDWTVTPQLTIPDERCYLSFDAQSYMSSKSDSLKIIIIETEENISALSAEHIARFKSEGKVVFHERLYPGASDEELAGDWQHFDISLAQYAGKKIYIAFVNDNYNQSAIFVDNVVVERSLIYSIALKNESIVLQQESAKIGGVLTIEAKELTFSSITLTLNDSEGNTIDTVTESGLSLKHGDNYRFDFTKELPLIVGEENNYSIGIKLDERTDKLNTSIKSLAFKPTKRVVLEKMTGTTCQFCPGGIIAIEEMKRVAGDQIIPVAIHTYTGDNLSDGLAGYSTALSLAAAPTARIDRLPIIASPLWTNNLEDDDDYGMLSFSNKVDNDTWLDLMNRQLAELTTTDISIVPTFNTADQTISIETTVKSALNAEELSYSLFTVIVEDGIIGNQDNNYFSNPDPLLGDWGKGGKYGQRTVNNYVYEDVARATIGETFNGTAGVLPATMTANTKYNATIQAPLMGSVSNWNNAKAVVMIIDTNTGLVINAAVAKFTSITGIEGVSGNASIVNTEYFTLGGTQITAPQKGINIVRHTYSDGSIRTLKTLVR